MSLRMEQGMEHFRNALAAVLAERVEFPRGVFVTVLDAKLTRDLLHAKAVLSVLPEDRIEDVKISLEDYKRDIKDGLAHELELRRIPDLFWEFDTTEARAAVIEKTLNELKREGEI
ncbi:ribosome-binding factor A [Candidatus Uhrbacteria bacterium]|nr:ribosome-binding factor A [Candidatus Uhrbacteria bacterium]